MRFIVTTHTFETDIEITICGELNTIKVNVEYQYFPGCAARLESRTGIPIEPAEAPDVDIISIRYDRTGLSDEQIKAIETEIILNQE